MCDIKQFKPAVNIDDAWGAVDAFPLKPGDPRYVSCSEIRGADTVRKIERMLNRHIQRDIDLHLLFTGYRGTGKTTELYQLQHRIQNKYEVIYFDAAQELDVNNLSLTDMLLAIAKVTVEHMEKKGYSLPNNILEDVGDWFFERVLEKSETVNAEVGAKAEIGIPKWVSFITSKVFSSVKMGTEDREVMRRKLEKDITDLISRVNKLLGASRDTVKVGNKKDLVFIMDSLDRIVVELGKKLFQANGALLKDLNGHFIYVVPISLLYDEQASLLPFDDKLILPMIPIFQKGEAHNPDEIRIKHLLALASKRVVLKSIFSEPENTITELILASGGHLRDLMKLISYACNETDDKITPAHANTAINLLVRDYERVVRDEEYEHLVVTYKTQAPPNNPINQKLIYNNVILVYEESDGTEWKDVHPAVVRNSKFKRHWLQDNSV